MSTKVSHFGREDKQSYIKRLIEIGPQPILFSYRIDGPPSIYEPDRYKIVTYNNSKTNRSNTNIPDDIIFSGTASNDSIAPIHFYDEDGDIEAILYMYNGGSFGNNNTYSLSQTNANIGAGTFIDYHSNGDFVFASVGPMFSLSFVSNQPTLTQICWNVATKNSNITLNNKNVSIFTTGTSGLNEFNKDSASNYRKYLSLSMSLPAPSSVNFKQWETAYGINSQVITAYGNDIYVLVNIRYSDTSSVAHWIYGVIKITDFVGISKGTVSLTSSKVTFLGYITFSNPDCSYSTVVKINGIPYYLMYTYSGSNPYVYYFVRCNLGKTYNVIDNNMPKYEIQYIYQKNKANRNRPYFIKYHNRLYMTTCFAHIKDGFYVYYANSSGTVINNTNDFSKSTIIFRSLSNLVTINDSNNTISYSYTFGDRYLSIYNLPFTNFNTALATSSAKQYGMGAYSSFISVVDSNDNGLIIKQIQEIIGTDKGEDTTSGTQEPKKYNKLYHIEYRWYDVVETKEPIEMITKIR